MTERLYTSSEVREILDISQRRMTHFAEKGLIIPVEDAKGAGSKRLYNHENLFEFALCQMLFDMELGIHLVKGIISDLRKNQEIRFWLSKNPENLVSSKRTITDSKGNKVDGYYIREDALSRSTKTNHGIGTLYYVYGKFEILKQSYKDVFRETSPEKSPDFKKILKDCAIKDYLGMIVINVERIKRMVNEGIKKIK